MQNNNLPHTKILVFGAGKSATCLIDYLIQQAAHYNWHVVIADSNIDLAQNKSGGALYASPVQVDVQDDEKRNELIEQAGMVISMLPPSLHSLVAKNCVAAGRHLLTASYVDEAIRGLAPEIKKKGILFLCEMGLDPGIDHMSAMQLIHRIHNSGGKIHSFYSHCGGLVAPESDNNPWHYKVSWNPRNLVLAGKAGAVYTFHNKTLQLPYRSLFDPGRIVEIPGYGPLAWYPNRNSLPYISLYGLQESATFIRTTLRHPDFCTGWKKIVELDLTDETKQHNTNGMSYKIFFETHLRQQRLAAPLSGNEEALLAYLGLYEEEEINKGLCTAADILQMAVEKRLQLEPEDKDMIVMLHEIAYRLESGSGKIRSTLIVKGENSMRTAMAKTVGLPLGIAATLLLQGKISLTGLHIPIVPEIYRPVLEALQKEGIVFKESYEAGNRKNHIPGSK
ncbi:MAG TPA: saccharopine dehydrogenase C-terminal domain-containing protein [Agriterribacter sp.]|nr:saccharopine dehydrogenase C-terminal domain-containing protein [Agriterribacter sp.]